MKKKKTVVMLCAAIIACLSTGCIIINTSCGSADEKPVLLANGEVMTLPWYVTINGEKIVLVKTKDDVEKVIQRVIANYENDINPDSGEILDVEIVEEIKAEPMDIKFSGNYPEILTVQEAEDKIMEMNRNDKLVTVVMIAEKSEKRAIECTEEYKTDPDMEMGTRIIQNKGKNGLQQVTTRTVITNGKTVEKQLVEEKIIKDPINRLIVTGIKNTDGYGGAEYIEDEKVSYDEEATYLQLENPLTNMTISSPYGPRWGRFHYGTDLASPEGSEIYATENGHVYCAEYNSCYGNIIKIDHENGMQTHYAHCSKLLVDEGQEVKRGELIGLVGSTGNSTGPHLHFEVVINGKRVNPMDFLAPVK